MNSWSIRACTAFILGVSVLVALCAMASYSDSRHRLLPLVELQILRFGSLERVWNGEGIWDGEDQVTLLLNVTADLGPAFTWNTKQLFAFVAAEYSSTNTAFNQIVLWDTIIEKKEDSKIQQQVLAVTKPIKNSARDGPFTYPFKGKSLQGCEFNLTMYWNVMPIAGTFFTNKVVVAGFQLPQQYS